MKINDVDVSKLPADVRKEFKTLQVMYAEKKIQNRAKKDFLSFGSTLTSMGNYTFMGLWICRERAESGWGKKNSI